MSGKKGTKRKEPEVNSESDNDKSSATTAQQGKIDAATTSNSKLVLMCGTANPEDSNSKKKVSEMTLLEEPHIVSTLSGKNIAAVFSGPSSGHAFALTSDGKCYGWGKNKNGQLGIDPEQQSLVLEPVLIDSLQKHVISKVATGRGHTLFLTKEGKVLGCGANDMGQLGNVRQSNHKPVVINGTKELTFKDIAVGAEFSVAVESSGAVYTWGSPEYGQLGIGSDRQAIGAGKIIHAPVRAPQKIVFPSDVKIQTVTCGNNHTLALTETGDVFSWGFGGYGRLGHKEQKDEHRPRKIEVNRMTPVTLMASGAAYNLAIGAHNVLYAWGKVKQTGDSIMYPQPVSDLQGWKITVMSCGNTTLCVVGDGKAIGWGSAQNGELGFKDQKSSAIPKLIEPLTGVTVTQIACGNTHTWLLAEKSDATDKLPKYPAACPSCSSSLTALDADSGEPMETVSCSKCSTKSHAKCAGVTQPKNKKKKTKEEPWTCPSCAEQADKCASCKKSTLDNADEVLICDGCDKEFHMKCVDPNLKEVPEGDWHCNSCSSAAQPPKKKRRF